MQLKRIKGNFGEKFSIFSKNYKNYGDYASKQPFYCYNNLF